MEVGSDSDSDFYGPVGTVYRLTRRARTGEKPVRPSMVEVKGEVGGGDAGEVKDEEVSEGMLTHQLLRMIPPAPVPSPMAQPSPQSHIDNSRHRLGAPRLGPYECQLGEDISMFLRRLPPATTMKDERTPWIYVRNPSIGRPRRPGTGSQLVPGCEDEGPEAEGSHVLLFVTAAKERLDLLRSFLDGITRMGVPGTAALRDMDSARQSAAKDIVGLAGRLGVTCGKWMLFVQPRRVNRSWEAVARATHRGDLGIAAKVAPRDPELALDAAGEAKSVRLVCIYTSDFRDIDDITRVLRRLESMRLVTRGRGRIYYKCDAYTYLGIGANNPWGLRASLFSSDDVFARLDSMLE